LKKCYGLIKCVILPPKDLFIPVLPKKINNKLLFVLCYTCGLTENKEACTHTESERAIHGTFCTPEVMLALEKGYKILKTIEIWDFPDTETFNPLTNKGGLFTDYIKLFLKIKQEASGFPDDIVTHEQMKDYIKKYEVDNGILLDIDAIVKNPGLRLLAKLLLNNLWGRFGMRLDQPHTVYVTEPSKFYTLLNDKTKEVKSINMVSDEMIEVKYAIKDEFLCENPTTNVVIAGFTTSLARIELYRHLDKIGKNVLYTDTDSIAYLWYPGAPEIELGNNLGQMMSETPGTYITKFVSGGPKNYAYTLKDARPNGKQTVVKVKGINLHTRNKELINFESMKDLVLGITTEPIKTIEKNAICRDIKKTKLFYRRLEKLYSFKFTKRVIKENFVSYPYGY